MKLTVVLAALMIAGCGGTIINQPVQPAETVTSQETSQEIIVKFKTGYAASAVAVSFHSKYGARHVSSLEQIGYHLFRLDPGINPAKALEAILADPRVEVAQFNQTYHLPPLPDQDQ